MKKRLVAYLMISALAVTVLAGCGSKGDAAGDAATGEAAVEEAIENVEVVEDASAALTAAIEEAAATADTGAAVAEDIAEAADTSAAAVEEYVDDEMITDAAADAATTVAAEAEKVEDLIVDPGTVYTVRFGGNVYGTPDESTAVIDYVYPGYILQIDERLDDYWYAITYIIDGQYRNGYIKIQ